MNTLVTRLNFHAAIIFASFVFWEQAVRADEPTRFKFEGTVSAAMRKLAQHHLNEMIAGRERLVSGEYTAVGRVGGKHKDAQPLDGEISLYSSFDFRASRMRFDRRELQYLDTLLNEGSEDAGSPAKNIKRIVKIEMLEGRCVAEPDRWIDWHNQAPGEVRIYPRTESWTGGIARPFDIRVVPLTLLIGMDTHMSFEALLSIYLKQVVNHVVMETEDVCRITWDFGPTERIRRILWIDQSIGYSPIRMEFWSSGPRDMPSTPPKLLTRASCTWREQQHVWIPASFVIEGELNGPRPRQYELAFEWTKVNEPVDAAKFTPDGLKIGNYARVMDVRGDVPVMVAELNGPSPLAPPVAMPQAKQSSFPLLVINLGVILIVTALVIAWRITSSSNRQE